MDELHQPKVIKELYDQDQDHKWKKADVRKAEEFKEVSETWNEGLTIFRGKYIHEKSTSPEVDKFCVWKQIICDL